MAENNRKINILENIWCNRNNNILYLLLQLFLLPFSLIYSVVIKSRFLFYNLRIFNRKKLDIPVISIGNLTVGGSGKTPLTMMIASKLLERSNSCAILSRGYKSQSEQGNTVFQGLELTPEDCSKIGDEAAMMAKSLPKCYFGVGSNRLQSASLLKNKYPIDCFILDDGFQHWQIHRDLDIVLIDANSQFGNGFLLPAGPVREGLSALKRANIIIITNCQAVENSKISVLREHISKSVSDEVIFETVVVLDSFRNLESEKRIEIEEIQNRSALLVSGIANPIRFSETLASAGVNVLDHKIFLDHYNYNNRDISEILADFTKSGADFLITTAKDAVKFNRADFFEKPCLIAEIKVVFREREDIFWSKIFEVF